LRLSPFDPLAYLFAGGLSVAHLVARRFEQAVECADRALHDQPRFMPATRFKLVANAHLGRLDEARVELSRLVAIQPGLTIAAWRAFSASSAAPEFFDLMVAGLRLAGLPEA
jgi:tetratricopeptide (TPR) repeat protein